jgi:hypothetical protein
VITWPTAGERVRLGPDGTLTVRGVSLDASKVSEVIVNGQVATLDPNGMDWSVTFDDVPEGGIVIEANATDTEGLVEALPHALTVWISRD